MKITRIDIGTITGPKWISDSGAWVKLDDQWLSEATISEQAFIGRASGSFVDARTIKSVRAVEDMILQAAAHISRLRAEEPRRYETVEWEDET